MPVRVGEVAETDAVLARLVMLETDAREMIADRQQEIVVAVMTRTEQRSCLAHHAPVLFDLLLGRRQFRRAVGEDVEAHGRPRIVVEHHRSRVRSREQRRVDQVLERHDGKLHRIALPAARPPAPWRTASPRAA